MEDIAAWQKEQLAEVKAIKDDAKKWRTELKKEAREWHDATLREFHSWRYEIEDEIKMLKGEAKDGHKRTTELVVSNSIEGSKELTSGSPLMVNKRRYDSVAQ